MDLLRLNFYCLLWQSQLSWCSLRLAWLNCCASKHRDTISKIGEQIQGYDNRIGQIATFLRSYLRIDKEPYSTQLDELQTEAAGLHTQVQDFLRTCQGFEEEIRQAGTNRFQDIINSPVNGFRHWRLLVRTAHRK